MNFRSRIEKARAGIVNDQGDQVNKFSCGVNIHKL